MKLLCTQENLKRGLNLVSHIASKNVTLPILSNVLLKAEQGVLTLLTTNLEMGIICTVRGKIEKEGSFTVQARLLNDYISLLPNEKVDIELVNQELKIQCKNSKTTIKGIEASEFPLIPQVESKDAHLIKIKDFKDALSQVAFAVAFDESRPEINGVYMNFQDNKLTMAATDSYRLAEKTVVLDKSSGKKQGVIIPLRTIHELIRVLGDESEQLAIAINENQIQFSYGDVNVISRLVEGQYPDYKQIIPKEYLTKVAVDTTEFIKVIKAASLFCKPGVNDVVFTFSPTGHKIDVSAVNVQLGENTSTLEGQVEGEENNIVFNSRYILEGLQNIGSEEVVLEINKSVNPGLLRPKDGNDYVYIIMPIKQ